MRVTAKKEERQFTVNYRNRFEYLVLLVPFVGIFLAVFLAFFQKAMRRVLNICAFKVMMFMLGGALVYVFIYFNLVSNILGILVLFALLLILWIIVPMYCVYILVFYLDDIKLKELIAVGYKIQPEIQLIEKKIFLLK